MNPYKYLVVKGCAGIGNRLITLCAAIDFAKKSNRKLVIDWSDGQFAPKGIDAFWLCFSVNGIEISAIEELLKYPHLNHSSSLFKAQPKAGIYELFESRTYGFWNRVPEKFLFNSILKKLKRRWHPTKGSFVDALNFGEDLSLKSKSDVLYYMDFVPKIDWEMIPKTLRLNVRLQQRVTKLSKSLGLANATGVHVRSTDKRPEKNIKDLIDYLAKTVADSPLFLCTDSLEVQTQFAQNIKNLVVLPKIQPELGSLGLHQWSMRCENEELKVQLYEEAVVEMFLLSTCKKLYYQGNSTYSFISSLYHLDPKCCFDWQALQLSSV